MSQKPEKHHLDDGKYIIRGMSKIGGQLKSRRKLYGKSNSS